MKEETEEKEKKSKGKGKRVVLLVILILVLAGAGVVLLPKISAKKEEPEIITQAQLQNIINISDLSTYEAVYNGVSKVMNEKKPEKVDYYVSYEARVKAGFDFEKLEISVDNEKKRITVNIPKIEINDDDIDVDIASLDYIFENKKANTSTVSEEAYKQCIEDVKEECQSNEEIFELAADNAKNIVKALVDPYVEQLDSEYELVINVEGENTNEESN